MKNLFTNSFLRFIFTASILLAVNTIFAQEICDNRIDDDGDGLIDCLDPDCDDHISCFTCDPSYYQVHSNSSLVLLDPFTGNYTTLGSISGVDQINGQTFNVLDGHVYAPAKIGNQQTLVMINKDGSTKDLGLDLGTGSIYYVGGADDEGIFYLSKGGGNIIKVDLTKVPLSYEVTGIPSAGVADFAFNVQTRKLYGVNGSHKLKVIDPVTEEIQTIDLAGVINNETGGYGAVWASGDGLIFAYNNKSGKIFKINTTDFTTALVVNGTGNLSTNDGFNCITAPSPFETDCNNGIDDDGDGLIDCEDPDCGNDNICLVEICDNGIDDDLDGYTDCADSECISLAICIEICDNGEDDNGDGYIDGDDPQCQTGTAFQGGLESNRRLSSAIAKRNYTRKKAGDKIIYNQKVDRNAGSLFGRGDVALESLVPVNAIPGLETFVSTPKDLIDITNANDVFSADFLEDGRRIASALILQTKDEVYEHTKFICDRLDGASLMDISNAMYLGQEMITMEVLQADGKREYACSFSAYWTGEKFQIENHWNLDRYPAGKDIFSFQLWANNYEHLNLLVEETMRKIAEQGPLSSFYNSAAPSVFVSNGKVLNNQVILNIVNKSLAQEVRFKGAYTKTESSDETAFDLSLPLNGRLRETIVLELEAFYNLGFRMTHDENSVGDDLFFSDGTWGLDVGDNQTIVHEFEIENLPKEIKPNVYSVARDISLQASSTEGFNIFRSLTPKFRPINLSTYNALQFEAKGKGSVEIVLVKAGIETWEEHFRTSILLDEEIKEYSLHIDQFKSKDQSLKLDLSDVSSILFRMKSNYNSEAISIDLKNLEFVQSELQNVFDPENEISMMVYPNPMQTRSKVYFNSDVNSDYEIKITDLAGKVCYSKSGQATVGVNELYVERPKSMLSGIYTIHVILTNARTISEKIIISN